VPLVLASLLTGLLFGLGLSISGMINPGKVLGFLDLAGNWDPTLGTVMAGAILGALPGFRLARTRAASLIGEPFQIPAKRTVDSRLLCGAVLFGAGWALAGFCPGPALAALGSGRWEVLIFVLAMVAGMLLYRVVPPRQ
jgi:uncharacterized membrane protein YedE/YeeE